MHFLYGYKKAVGPKLVATFSSEQQLLAYVRWATLQSFGEKQGKFEQGSALAGFDQWDRAETPLTSEPADSVTHNPTPNML
jgi:hypothetical protein